MTAFANIINRFSGLNSKKTTPQQVNKNLFNST